MSLRHPQTAEWAYTYLHNLIQHMLNGFDYNSTISDQMLPMYLLWKSWNSKSILWSYSGLNFNENGWVVSENEYFENFAEIFWNFLEFFRTKMLFNPKVFSLQKHWFFLKSPIVIYNGGKSESAQFLRKSFSEATEPVFLNSGCFEKLLFFSSRKKYKTNDSTTFEKPINMPR